MSSSLGFNLSWLAVINILFFVPSVEAIVNYPYVLMIIPTNKAPLRDQHQYHHQHQESPESATLSNNGIFFLADDQDLHLQSLSYQPLVKKHLIDKGLTFSSPLLYCCALLPSCESLDRTGGTQYQCHGRKPTLW